MDNPRVLRLRLHQPEAGPMDAIDYLKLKNGEDVEILARVNVRGLWRVRLAHGLARAIGRLLRSTYTLRTVEPESPDPDLARLSERLSLTSAERLQVEEALRTEKIRHAVVLKYGEEAARRHDLRTAAKGA